MSALVVQKGLKLATATRTRAAATFGAGSGVLGYSSGRLRGMFSDGDGGDQKFLVAMAAAAAGGLYYFKEVA